MCWTKSLFIRFWQWLIAPVAMLIAVIGGAVLLVASPLVWSELYEAPQGVSEYAQQDGERIARELWATTPYSEVSESLKGGKLVEREVHHYEDLQEKFRQLTSVVIVASLLTLSVFIWRKHASKRVIYLSLLWLLVIAVVGGAWSVYNWRQMFRALHWWIFQDDSWILPHGCYSLRLYPYAVWKKAMLFVIAWSFVVYLGSLTIASIRQRVKE